ncbi:hypothetical protein SCLCIDRAFT_31579 [Scleroderma citrinum Foug A]|uniref:Uncharacterized protein n=1 Tax=Scleroderma citrinum Foug A TaxID=1036808 RepID=A0A0C3DCM0_9AGAM|nr:hypothetical protein SCLCIDRAFT_31579 [Scleroderma citrinum Foug A]
MAMRDERRHEAETRCRALAAGVPSPGAIAAFGRSVASLSCVSLVFILDVVIPDVRLSPDTASDGVFLAPPLPLSRRPTKELASTRKRLESVERQLALLTKSSSPNPTDHLIADLEARVERAESARDEAEARRQLFSDHWDELHRYLGTLDIHAHHARSSFARTVAEAGGTLVLAPIPVLGQHLHHQQGSLHTPPSATSPAIMLVPPSHPRIHHRHSSSSSSLPPPQTNTPSSARVRPRSGSFDDQSPYLSAPPSKRHKTDRVDYDTHHPSSSRTRTISSLQPASSSGYPARSSHATHSRSSSRSSRRSLSIDEMLLEASTDDPRPRNEPQSPRVVLAHHQHPPSHHHPHLGPPSSRPLAAPSTIGPLDQPGELRAYQTHVFAPPVTGAPTKKGKLGSVNGVPPSATSAPSTAPPQTPATSHPLSSHPHTAPHHPPHPPSAQLLAPQAQLQAPAQAPTQTQPQPLVHRTPNGSFPPTNSLGQRICRQCGLAGRYKDGKCVEKWGPGPEGPGTVCDRCRKKMKRVERRGTIGAAGAPGANPTIAIGSGSVGGIAAGEGSNPLTHAHTMPARVSRTDTVPAHALVNTSSANGNGGVGPAGTQLIGSGFGSKRDRDRDRDRERERERGDRERERYTTSQPHPSQSPHPPHPHSSPSLSHLHPHPLSHLPYLHGRSSPSQRSSHSGHNSPPSSSTGPSTAGPGASGSGVGHRPDTHGIPRQTLGGEGPLPSPPPAIATLPPDEDDRPSSTSKPSGPSTASGSGAAGRPGKTSSGSITMGRARAGAGVKGRSTGARPSDASSSASADGDREADADVHADMDGEGEGDLDADGEEDADGDGDGDGGVDAEGDDAEAEAEAEADGDADMDVDVDSGRLNGRHHRSRRERRTECDHAEAPDEDDRDRDGEEGDKDPEDDLLEAVAAADRRKGGADLGATTKGESGNMGLSRDIVARFGGRGSAGVQRSMAVGLGVQKG